MTDRKKPSAGFWITVALVAVLVGYPLSFGPACWISSRCDSGTQIVTNLYRPILRLWASGPGALGATVHWYAHAFAKDRWDLKYFPDDDIFDWGYSIVGRD